VRVAWGAKDIGEVVGFANARPGPDFAALAPVVAARAMHDDLTAVRVLLRAAHELRVQVGIVWEKMQASGDLTGEVAYTGSVLEKIGPVREEMRMQIKQYCPGLRMLDGAVKTMEGAMWRARGGN
jgi:N-acetylglucosamine kinase-like BadF-type ATPase